MSNGDPTTCLQSLLFSKMRTLSLSHSPIPPTGMITSRQRQDLRLVATRYADSIAILSEKGHREYHTHECRQTVPNPIFAASSMLTTQFGFLVDGQ